MPTKSREERAHQSKSEGSPSAVRDHELHDSEALSGHAAKKSSHVEAREQLAGRTVGHRNPPGMGHANVPERSDAEAHDHFKSEQGTASHPGHNRKPRC